MNAQMDINFSNALLSIGLCLFLTATHLLNQYLLSTYYVPGSFLNI